MAKSKRVRHVSGALPAVLLLWANTAGGWQFVFLADSRNPDWSLQVNTQVLGELAVAISNEKPAFVLFGGDLANFGGDWAYREWTNAMAPLYAAGIPVYPLVGNHELLDVGSFTAIFGPGLPDNGPPGEIDRTYAITYSNVLVLMLDQYMTGRVHQVNLPWVEAILASNTRPHVFAAGHEPAFKIYHLDCLDDSPAERDQFWNLLRLAGGRVYLCGHDHFYDRMRLDDMDGNPSNDLWQLVVGTAGAPLYPDGPANGENGAWSPVREFNEAAWGFLRIDIEGETVTTSWRPRIGTNMFSGSADSLSYTRDPRPVLMLDQRSIPARLMWFGAAVLQSAPSPFGDFRDVPGARSPRTIGVPGGEQMFFRLRLEGPPP